MKLSRICEHCRIAGVKLSIETHTRWKGCHEQLYGFFNGRLNVDRHKLHDVAAAELEHAVDNCLGSYACLHDVVDATPYTTPFRSTLLGQGTVAQDCGEDVVDVMCDAASQAVQDVHFLWAQDSASLEEKRFHDSLRTSSRSEE